MIGNTYSIRFVLPVSIILAFLAAGVAQANQNGVEYPRLVEVFTTADSPVNGVTALNTQPGYWEIEFHIYELDAIQRIEAKLSKGLTADPKQSKRVVLQRFHQLPDENRAQLQRAAMGLAKAMQYGVDRYPAIVFDGVVLIYGVTDIREALHRYKQWRQGGMQ
jgi:integrating conjugative element protein (TIGR03757 family)